MKTIAFQTSRQKLGLFLAAACCFSTFARADEPVTITIPVIPPGTNPAIVDMPRVEWVSRALASDAKAARQQPPAKLVFDGDSITDFWQTTGKEVLAKNFAKYNVFDFGISADRTEHLLWRLDHGQADAIHPKLIALMIGTNNLGRDKDDQIAEAITAIVHDYQKRCPDAVILLQGIFPRGEKATDPLRARIKTINGLITKLGDGKKVIFLDFGEQFLQPDGTLTRDIMGDFLHPTAKGYEIWADAIRPAVAQVLGDAPAS